MMHNVKYPLTKGVQIRLVAAAFIVSGFFVLIMGGAPLARATNESPIDGPGSTTLTDPAIGSTVSGTVPVTGSTDPTLFSFFDVFVCPSELSFNGSDPEPVVAGCTLLNSSNNPVADGTLATWNTNQFPDSFFDVFVQVHLSTEEGDRIVDWHGHRTVRVLNPPVTTKTYGEPNEAALIKKVPACNDDGHVSVNGHLIATSTTITLTASDNGDLSGTFYSVLVPVGCEQGDIVEWAGLSDHNLYEDSRTCSLAVDNPETEELETQECVATFWQLKDEIMDGEEVLEYESPFVIDQESTHKICFFSEDQAGNTEALQCQVAFVDNNQPDAQATVDHTIVDIENYQGGGGNLYFADPKCTQIIVETNDTHGTDDVDVGTEQVLQAMFTNLTPDSQGALDEYFSDPMHNPSLANGMVEQVDADTYRYWFCPGKHIYHLYSMNVLSWNNFGKFLSEDLVLGEFGIPITVTDSIGRSSQDTVDLTIVDLTVPLDAGWNLRSTPLALEGDRFWDSSGNDAVLRWDSQAQAWEVVTDNTINPLDALYFHATTTNEIGYIFERDITAPPVRNLDEQWNLVGMAIPLNDYWQQPYSCDSPFDQDSYDSDGEYGDYYAGSCNLTYLYTSDSMNTREVFLPVVYDAQGNSGVSAVISPQENLSYSDEWGNWYFYQYADVWIPRITSGGADPSNSGFDMINFGGYWAFMQNDALWPGFTTTPLNIYGD